MFEADEPGTDVQRPPQFGDAGNGTPAGTAPLPTSVANAALEGATPGLTAIDDGPAAEPARATLGGLLDRAAFLAHAQRSRPVQRVDLPWIGPDAHVLVRGMSANGKDRFEDDIYHVVAGKVVAKAEGIRAITICLCLCDATGNQLCTLADLPAIQGLDGKTADAIYAVASRLSGMTQQDVDELVKNSERARSGGRSSR